jgi:hypothetical protein
MKERKKIGFSKLLLVCLVTIILFIGINAETPKKRNPLEVQVYLLGRIPRHIDWPPGSGLDDPQKPFVLSVIGGNPFDKWLDNAYPRKKILGKNVRLRYIKDVSEIDDTHLLFIAPMSRKELTKVLDYTREKPILTVSASDGYARRGVHINFYMAGKIKLEINETAVRHADLLMKPSFIDKGERVEPYNEYRDKAQHLEEIIAEVKWPATAGMEDRSKPFFITVLGESPLGDELKGVFRRKRVEGKKVFIRTVSVLQAVGSPNVLFIARPQGANLASILDYVKDKPILTVGDTDGFAREGVHVNFYYPRVKLQMEVNPASARKVGIIMLDTLIQRETRVRTRTRQTR